MKPDKFSKENLILYGFGLFPVIWLALLVAPYLSGGLSAMLKGLSVAFANPFAIQWVSDTPKCIALFIGAYVVGIGIYFSTIRNYRRGIEYGSARWGNANAVCKKYRDSRPEHNKILTQNVRIGLDGCRHRRNLNILCCGGSGAGKTRFFAKPNILQASSQKNVSCSYVCLDPKGELLRDTGEFLKKQGYEIRVLDLIQMEKSHGYNPFAYLRGDKDVLKLVTNLIRNTTPKNASQNDPFWEKSETALLEALILFLLSEAPPEEQNFSMVMEMIAAAEVREEDEEYQSPLDELFSLLEMRNPDHLAVRQYHIFKLAAGKTAKSILVSLGVRLEKFNLPSLAGMMMADELDIAQIGEKKMALFAIIPDNDSSFNFLVGMLYTQLFQMLYYQADQVHGGRLPVHVHFVMDEFANIALPDEFDKLLATMRSREISVSIIIQNMAQLKALFKDTWESLVGNCDEFLYLGGNEQSTHEYISKMLGKETLDTNTYGQSKGRNGSYSTNYQQTGRELMTIDEIRTMDNQDALLFIRGEAPIRDRKFDITKHKNFSLSADGQGNLYRHGEVTEDLDWRTIELKEDGEYVLLSQEELEELFESEETNHEENEP